MPNALLGRQGGLSRGGISQPPRVGVLAGRFARLREARPTFWTSGPSLDRVSLWDKH